MDYKNGVSGASNLTADQDSMNLFPTGWVVKSKWTHINLNSINVSRLAIDESSMSHEVRTRILT
jgi:hypothetical protein